MPCRESASERRCFEIRFLGRIAWSLPNGRGSELRIVQHFAAEPRP